MKKNVFKIITLGCKVNQYDSQNIREKLIAAGFKEAVGKEKADICIVNSCTVTGKAQRESLYQLRRCGRDEPGSRIILMGCAAGVEEGNAAQTDLIIRNRDRERLVPILRDNFPRLFARTMREDDRGESISFFKGRTRAFLKIQDGCDNFCAYCKVPFVRGKPVSKPLHAVLGEAAVLAGHGYKEIVLTGICLGRYGTGLPGRRDVVDAVEAVEPAGGVARIRLSSIEPGYVTPRLIRKLEEGGKLCPHLHIPLQSGDDSVLKRMNRGYTAARFTALVRKLRARVSDFALTTDVMAGFPGETEANFRNTLELIRVLEPLKVHIFPFSPRPGTKAASMQGRLGPEELKERVKRLEDAAEKTARRFRSGFAGRRMEVLVEGRAGGRPGYWQGYAKNYLEVLVKSTRDLANTLYTARIR